MFKTTICLFVLAVASGAVSAASIGGRVANEVTTEKREIVPVLSFAADKSIDGSFSFSYEGGDKSYREETGSVSNAGTEDETLEVQGSYRYIDAEGQLVEVRYTAGKNGFVPIGNIIPLEISNLAKAAAELPEYTQEQERADRFSQRRARSKIEEETVEAVKTLVATEPVKAEPETVVAAESVKTETVVAPEPVKAKTIVAAEPANTETVVAAESVKTETVVAPEPVKAKAIVEAEPAKTDTVVAAESVKTETVVAAEPQAKTVVAAEPVKPVVVAAEPAVAASEVVPVKVLAPQ